MLEILSKAELFSGIEKDDISSLLDCLSAQVRSYEKGEFIFLAGKSRPLIGIVISGRAEIIKENACGGKTVIGEIRPPDMFGETFALTEKDTVGVSALAKGITTVLFFDVKRIVRTCCSACAHHSQLILNLLNIVARKNTELNRKLYYISHRTIRGRLLAYFEDMAENSGSPEFTIPFSKSCLADYLCMDRSAMARELREMKKDGLVDFHKNTFRLLYRIRQ